MAADLDKFISPDLPKFVESVFDSGSEDAHPWPLFASDRNSRICLEHSRRSGVSAPQKGDLYA